LSASGRGRASTRPGVAARPGATPRPGAAARRDTPAALPDLRGLWRRSLIERPDGSRDTTTWVRWLQGDTRFADLRQPIPLRAFGRLSGRAQLSREDCLWLARQEGFAGQLSYADGFYEWHRRIDFQPPSKRADAGALQWEGDVLVERGRDVAYLEHWHRQEPVATRPVCALELTRGKEPLQALLLRVGGCFMLAREREEPTPPRRTLLECVLRAPRLEDAQQLVDCEVSFGEVLSGGGLQILSSTLPWRIGTVLELRIRESGVSLPERSPDGRPVWNPWDIAGVEGRLRDFSAPLA